MNFVEIHLGKLCIELLRRLELSVQGESWLGKVLKDTKCPISRYSLKTVLTDDLFWELIESVCLHTSNLIQKDIDQKELSHFEYQVGLSTVIHLVNISYSWEYDLFENPEKKFPLSLGGEMFNLIIPEDFERSHIKSIFSKKSNYIFSVAKAKPNHNF